MEGTPYAFSEVPMLYEIIRDWLSLRLEISPLEIKLIGSARTGFSLAPADFGRRFGLHSDLDIAVVSTLLFKECKAAFNQWMVDYQSGIVTPRNAKEKSFWDQNVGVVSRSLERGFLDSNKIPTLHRYPIAQKVSQTMWLLKKKLDMTLYDAPKIRKSTIRIHNSWRSFHGQVKRNVNLSTKVVPMAAIVRIGYDKV
jgi:hypothetical protein